MPVKNSHSTDCLAAKSSLLSTDCLGCQVFLWLGTIVNWDIVVQCNQAEVAACWKAKYDGSRGLHYINFCILRRVSMVYWKLICSILMNFCSDICWDSGVQLRPTGVSSVLICRSGISILYFERRIMFPISIFYLRLIVFWIELTCRSTTACVSFLFSNILILISLKYSYSVLYSAVISCTFHVWALCLCSLDQHAHFQCPIFPHCMHLLSPAGQALGYIA